MLQALGASSWQPDWESQTKSVSSLHSHTILGQLRYPFDVWTRSSESEICVQINLSNFALFTSPSFRVKLNDTGSLSSTLTYIK